VYRLAGFRGDDEPCLVAAALACPACLSSDPALAVSPDDLGGEARCACRACGHRWVLGLTPDQVLRLSLQRQGTAACAA